MLGGRPGLSLSHSFLGNMTVFTRMSSWRRPVKVAGAACFVATVSLAGCISRADAPFTRVTDRPDGAGGNTGLDLDGGSAALPGKLPPTALHAVLGVSPPHGSFGGGGLALISGNGFASNSRVWFGGVPLDKSAIVPIDPQRIQITVPAGHSGPVDVSVQNGSDESTFASLAGGYSYDQFYADPAGGPTSGGTRITLKGDGTRWDTKTAVSIDQTPCEVDEIISRTELTCSTPAGTPGSKSVRVSTADGSEVDVLDGFVYGNSDNGFKGGLSGNTLRENLRVLALDNITSLALEGATVIVGSTLDDADVLKTDKSGVAVDSKPGLSPKRTVTIARKCYQPQTFVDVSVDTVTAFLDPVLSPACASPEGDLPPSGGSASSGANVRGQVVWPAAAEFRRDGWLNVPLPKSKDEKLVAYVMRLSSDPTARFTLPDATEAITPASDGDRGYAFSSFGQPGNFTLYALAGIENTLNPRRFTAYQMGLVRGVAAEAGKTKSDVFIQIDVDLAHTLTLNVTPPTVTRRGPDRLEAFASVRVGSEGFAPLPNGFISQNLPLSGPISFVGVPALAGSLLGTSYIATARAVTGQGGSAPRSVVGFVSGTTTSEPLPVDQFIQVPLLVTPQAGSTWNGKGLATTSLADGRPVDLFVFDVRSGSGLIGWTVVAPGNVTSFALPDLKAVSADLALRSGRITITVNAARVANFAYGTLRYRDIAQRGWASYATDVFYASY